MDSRGECCGGETYALDFDFDINVEGTRYIHLPSFSVISHIFKVIVGYTLFLASTGSILKSHRTLTRLKLKQIIHSFSLALTISYHHNSTSIHPPRSWRWQHHTHTQAPTIHTSADGAKEPREDREGEDLGLGYVNKRREPMAQFESVDQLPGWIGASEDRLRWSGSGK
jgi:hypothetical protein